MVESVGIPAICEIAKKNQTPVMPTLDNPRHEKFAQAVASGLKGATAYRKVYGEDCSGAKQMASQLLTNLDLKARIKELQEAAGEGEVLTLQQSLEYLTKAVTTPLEGVDETNVLCQSAKYTEGSREIKMVDKLRALEILSKLMGRFVEKVEHSGQVANTPIVVHIPSAIAHPRTVERALSARMKN